MIQVDFGLNVVPQNVRQLEKISRALQTHFQLFSC